MTVSFRLLNEDAVLPKRATIGSSGFDLTSIVDLLVAPNNTVVVSTGVAVNLVDGLEGQVRSRSGLASKGISVLNSPGTIDSDYTGELKVILHNSSQESFTIKKGMRIAQIVLAPVYMGIVEQSDECYHTSRGDGGFGSTGV